MLLQATEGSLLIGQFSEATVGNRLGDISAAVQRRV